MLCRLYFEPFPGMRVLQLVDSTVRPHIALHSLPTACGMTSCRMPWNLPAGVAPLVYICSHTCRPRRERTWYLAAVSPILQ